MMPSKYARKSGIITPRKFFICCEDEKKEIDYYERFLLEKNISEAEVEIIRKQPSFSKPADVLKAVNDKKEELRRKNQLIGIEEFWLCMDVDWWGPLLEDVVKACSKSNTLHPVVSKPCFEVWLLTHHFSSDHIKRKQSELDGKQSINILLASKRLSGDISKDYLPYTDTAIATSRILDVNPADDMPQSIGTKVYLLITAILEITTLR